MATVLVTRLILSLSGYPQIGGKGLHIAHVLPGGLLMLVAISLLLGYVGPVVRPAAALVGGIGFGLFIDEVGKFVTSDNDYFYQPTAAIVYVVFVLIVLATRFLTTRRPIDPREQLANVIDHAVEGVAGGLSRRRLAQASEELRQVGPEVAGRRETRELLIACPADEVELAAPVDALRRTVLRGFDRLATHPLAPTIAVFVLIVQVIGAPAIAAGIRFDNGLVADNPGARGGGRELAVGNVHGARCVAAAEGEPGPCGPAVRARGAGVLADDPGVPVRRDAVRGGRRDVARPGAARAAEGRARPDAAPGDRGDEG